MPNSKLINVNELKKLTYKLKGKKIVLCHGVFDLLHIGHIKHFEEAKKYGDVLIVSVTSDKFVNKGPNRPVFNLGLRAEALIALECVDYVIENRMPNPINLIKTIKPKFYAKGKDYKNIKDDITGNIKNEIKAIKSVGGKFISTKSELESSSKIINENNLLNFSSLQNKFLKKIKKKGNKEKFVLSLNKLKKVKVLVIGETIIDKYTFCDTIGKSSKEPILVLKQKFTKDYLGGAAAVCKQVSEFSESVSFLTMIGQNKTYQDFIKKNLSKRVKINFVFKKNSPTIVKKRYVDESSNSKTLGVYDLDDKNLETKNETQVLRYLIKNLNKFDLVIISDYGHGFITDKISKLISLKSKKVVINAQVNANNQGQHTLEKYKKSLCVIINESEMRSELRDKDGDIKFLIKKLSKKINTSLILTTMGREGSILFDCKKEKFYHCPAFANSVVDKVGAGDAMLSSFSMINFKNEDPELSLFLSSLVAANTVKEFGNDRVIKVKELVKILEHIYLK